MMNVRHIAAGLMMVALAAMWGCTSVEPLPDQAPVDERPLDTPADTGASSSGARLDNGAMGSAMTSTSQPLVGGSADSLDDPNSPLAKRIFYFAFDSSTLDEIDRDILAAHGRYLASHPGSRVVIEGHTDERGSREYNLALGERRAAAVEQIVTLQGATKAQVQVVSFGEERPVDLGHDEAAWGQNRRAELTYAGR